MKSDRSISPGMLLTAVICSAVVPLALLLTHLDYSGLPVFLGIAVAIIILCTTSWGFYIFVFAITAVASHYFLDYRIVISNIPISIIDGLLVSGLLRLAVTLLRRTIRRKPRGRMDPIGVAMILLCGVYLVGLIVGILEQNSWYTILQGLRYQMFILLGYFWTLHVIRTRASLMRLCEILCIGTALNSLQAIIPRLEGISGFGGSSVLELRTLGDTSGAQFIALLLAAALFFNRAYILRSQWITFLCFATLFLWICISFFRQELFQGLLGVSLLFVFTAGKQSRRQKVLFVVLIVGLIGATYFSQASFFSRTVELLSQVAETLRDLAGQGSYEGKVVFYEYVWRKFLEAPVFGHGLGEVSGYTDYTGPLRSAFYVLDTTVYGYYIINFGLLGILASLWLQWAAFLVAYRMWRRTTEPLLRAVAEAALVFSLIGVADFAGRNTFLAPQTAVCFGLLLGIVSCARRMMAESEASVTVGVKHEASPALVVRSALPTPLRG